MRQSNQNKRLRSRNRKGPNPLTKSFESNGPDGKIRGTALSIAEKYIQASRDAAAAGDRVKAENLLQHAEHYNRIVAAAQAQMQPAHTREPEPRQDYDDEDDMPAFLGARPLSAPDAPQPTVDHSSQVANGIANGKIPNGVRVDNEATAEDESSQSIRAEEAGDESARDGDGRRRPRGRPRGASRRPMQPSAIVAEVANMEADPTGADGSDGGD